MYPKYEDIESLKDDLEDDDSQIVADILEEHPKFTDSRDDIYGALYSIVFDKDPSDFIEEKDSDDEDRKEFSVEPTYPKLSCVLI